MNRVSGCCTRVSHYHSHKTVQIVSLAVRALKLVSTRVSMPAWSQAVASLVVRHTLLWCMHKPSPELSIFVLELKFLSPFKLLFSGIRAEATLDAILTTCFLTSGLSVLVPYIFGHARRSYNDQCGVFRVATVKFRTRDARTTHGDYRLEWGSLRLIPITYALYWMKHSRKWNWPWVYKGVPSVPAVIIVIKSGNTYFMQKL